MTPANAKNYTFDKTNFKNNPFFLEFDHFRFDKISDKRQ